MPSVVLMLSVKMLNVEPSIIVYENTVAYHTMPLITSENFFIILAPCFGRLIYDGLFTIPRFTMTSENFFLKVYLLVRFNAKLGRFRV
jgi:hypothetical protein